MRGKDHFYKDLIIKKHMLQGLKKKKDRMKEILKEYLDVLVRI